MATWHEVYSDAVERFGGQRPGAQLEAELVQAFEQHPAEVQAAIVKLGGRFSAARVRSPWPLVLREVEDAVHRSVVVADTSADRERLIHLAELRVRNIGHVLPDEHELREELFGRRALLEPWAGDELLVARMLALWREQVAPSIVWPGH